MRKYGRQEFRTFVSSMLAFLPEQERNAHGVRLEALEVLYDLAYGAIIEAITSVQSSEPGVLETAFRATFMDHGTDTTEPLTVSVDELTPNVLVALLDRTLDDANGPRSLQVRFLMLLSG